MKISKTLFLLLILASTSFLEATAQSKTALVDAEKTSNLKEQATQMVTAFNRGDLERFATFTYPKVLQSIGGKAAMVNLLKGQRQQWEQQEYTGIYDLPLLNWLQSQGAQVWLESGVQIAKSTGVTRGKNDKVDSCRIAMYAYTNRYRAGCGKRPNLFCASFQHFWPSAPD